MAVDVLVWDGALLAPSRSGRRVQGLGERGVVASLDRLRSASSILEGIRSAPALVESVESAQFEAAPERSLLGPLLEAIDDRSDSLTAIAAIHALGRVPGRAAEARIASLIEVDAPGLAEHAIWALLGREASPGLVGLLATSVGDGGLGGMNAQRVLARWARTAPDAVLQALRLELSDRRLGPARRYLTETIGLLPGATARSVLAAIAMDSDEPEDVRCSAIAAFADRRDGRLPAGFGELSRGTGEVAVAVRDVRAERLLVRRGPRRADNAGTRGLRVAQVHLGAVLDPAVSRAGMGDTGGVATLLSRLGVALAERPHIGEVLTIGRTEPASSRTRATRARGHRFESVALEPGEGGSFSSTWPSVVAATRGIRRAFLSASLPDVVHLRMADPGSLAASRVARVLGVPVVFTLAPDPHGPIAAAERAGSLDRRTFAAADGRDHLWFRASLVEHLAQAAAEVVLFPQRDIRRRLRDLVGLDVTAGPPRYSIVAEGIDHTLAIEARELVSRPRASRRDPVLRDLSAAINALPRHRHGLPIVVSVGRMHRLKGMARIVAAFAGDEQLAARANLVIIGGDLEAPSAEETGELSRIKTLFDAHPGLADAVVLMGHRPNSEIGKVLASARAGLGQVIAPGGAYVCGSGKEEFGLAIVEAMAAGLPVVAPLVGGPATYVEHAVTGMLVDTLDPGAIAQGLGTALTLSGLPETAARARGVVEAGYTIERMARTLAAVYRVTAAPRGLGLPMSAGRPA